MASNLLSDAHEESRDGQSVAATLCTGIIDFDMWHKDKSSNSIHFLKVMDTFILFTYSVSSLILSRCRNFYFKTNSIFAAT